MLKKVEAPHLYKLFNEYRINNHFERKIVVKKLALVMVSLFSLQLLVGCGSNQISNVALSKNASALNSLSSVPSGYESIDYRDFRNLWDRTCGLSKTEDPARYQGKKYAIKAIMEYQPCTSFAALRWNALLYEPSGKDHSNAFYVLTKTFLTHNQADKFYQNLGGVRADDVIGGAVDPDTGKTSVKQHPQASPMTIYFAFDAKNRKSSGDMLKIDAIKTSLGVIVKF